MFRHLLEEHELGAGLFEEIASLPRVSSGGDRIVDAKQHSGALIGEESGKRDCDPEMHQTKKGNE